MRAGTSCCALHLPLEAVSVAVKDGEVRLAGELETRTETRAVVKEVRHIAGVVAVHSSLSCRHEKLAVEPEPEPPPVSPASAEPAREEDEPVLAHEP